MSPYAATTAIAYTDALVAAKLEALDRLLTVMRQSTVANTIASAAKAILRIPIPKLDAQPAASARAEFAEQHTSPLPAPEGSSTPHAVIPAAFIQTLAPAVVPPGPLVPPAAARPSTSNSSRNTGAARPSSRSSQLMASAGRGP
jgi:hypothetical protein